MNSHDKLATIHHSANLTRIPDDACGFLTSQIANNFEKQDKLFIAQNDFEMDVIASQIRFFAPQAEIITFFAWDCLPFDRASPKPQILANRIKALHRLSNRKADKNFFIITSINALLQKTVAASEIKNLGLFLQIGSRGSISQIADFLTNKGYRRQGCANNVGEFAVRGGIIDIVVQQAADLVGYRLDFLGDEIESIKIFDPITQISQENVKNLEILPASEVLLNEATIAKFCQNYRAQFGATIDDQFYQAISEGRTYDGMEHWLPLFFDCELVSFLSYLNNPVLFLSDKISRLAVEREELIAQYFETRSKEKEIADSDSIYNPLKPSLLYFTSQELFTQLSTLATIEFHSFDSPSTNRRIIDLQIKSVPDFALAGRTNRCDPIQLMQSYIIAFAQAAKNGEKTELSQIIAIQKEQENQSQLETEGQFKPKPEFKFDSLKNKKIAFALVGEGAKERIARLFHDFGMATSEVKNIEELRTAKPGKICLLTMPLNFGFETDNLLLIGEQALFGEKIFRKRNSKSSSQRVIEEGLSINQGELIVHRDHGIGKFDGIHTIISGKVKTDMIKILYGGGDVLFVPVDEINLISRYGADNPLIQLDRLGAAAWKNRREKVRKKIKLAAEELLKVAAARRLKKSPIFTPDQHFYDEFKARFGFVETDDQMRTIEEVEEDLRRGSPMDRLVCGDVGFGKTEVAIRASAIVCKEAQVAVVVPTTILSRQHYKNFCKRFEGTGIKIAQLSRLVSVSDNKITHEEIASGKVQIVIGTHALLQKNIKFHNLGLVIIDEEQHFGVAQKERLKQFRSETHILTLSATPIPRTLQMSLTGVKDLSIISTPPLDRLAVRNFLMPYDSVIVREAVMREYNRSGKVFFVVPRIRDVEEMEPRLKILLPELKITHAHGQMTPSQLDGIMNDFIDGKIDVLLSTTIIESGIDISSANTMIIYKAEMFGLAQLYQLRGRVGRGKVRGYCYFMLDNRKRIASESRKKLEVMQNLDSLGIGFTVASHDMDIRGGGNVLGDEQSGHIKETGIELYQQMLLDTIEKLKSDPEFFNKESSSDEILGESSTILIRLGVSLLIPVEYIADLPLRMSFYKKISNLKNPQERSNLIDEMHDRFGKIPSEVINLIEVALIKSRCQVVGVAAMEIVAEGLQIAFCNNRFAAPEKLMQLIFANKSQIRLVSKQRLIFTGFSKNDEERIRFASDVLSRLEALL